MTASELIQRLQALIAEHGDLPVYHYDDWDAFLVEQIHVEAARVWEDGEQYPTADGHGLISHVSPAAIVLESGDPPRLIWHEEVRPR